MAVINPHVSAPARLDQQALDRLRELDPDGRRGVVQRVLTAFEGSLTRTSSVLQAQAQAEVPDVRIISDIAHTLKSSAASVGALTLARTCADVERLIREQPGREFAPEIEHLLADSAAALAAVRAILQP